MAVSVSVQPANGQSFPYSGQLTYTITLQGDTLDPAHSGPFTLYGYRTSTSEPYLTSVDLSPTYSGNTVSLTFSPSVLNNTNVSVCNIKGPLAYDYQQGAGWRIIYTDGTRDASGTAPFFYTINYTKCGAPTSCAVNPAVSIGSNAVLSWAGATDGQANKIARYELQRAESKDGKSWGSWTTLGTTANTSISVAPPATIGNYYKFRVRAQGTAGEAYYSDWKESTNTLYRPYTKCGAPTSCAVDTTLSLVATILRWSGATAGQGNPISKYEVQRRSRSPRGSWSDWSQLEVTSGTSISVSPPTTAGHYYQYRVRTQGTAGEAYYSDWKVSTNALRKAHQAIPAFTDPTLVVGQTEVKAVHITELQNALNNILLPFAGLEKIAFSIIVKDSSAKHWGAHVQELKSAIDSIISQHETWVPMQDEVTADVIEQLRKLAKRI